MTGDMTCKEYAYMLLMQNGVMLQSELEYKLREVYKEQCVDCLLRELHEDKHITVQAVHYNDTTDYQLQLNMEEEIHYE
jgi:hypothetical protein